MPITADDQGAVYGYLEDADRAIEAGNPGEGSILLYKSIAHALTCLARQRGFPHATAEDLSAFASKLDAEHKSEHLHFISFAAARALHDNVEMEFADQDELLLSRPDLGEFLDLLLTY